MEGTRMFYDLLTRSKSLLLGIFFLFFSIISLVIITLPTKNNYNLFTLDKTTSSQSFKNLMIILDYDQEETIKRTLQSEFTPHTVPSPPKGVGAITGSALIALNSKAAPILISKSLIHNICGHSQIFKDFIILSCQKLWQKYGPQNTSFKRFNKIQDIENFKQHCIYAQTMHKKSEEYIKKYINNSNLDKAMIEKAVYKISTEPVFSDQKAPLLLQNPPQNAYNRSMHIEVTTYFINYYCSEELKNWTIKDISPDLYLCIPSDYIKQNTTYFNNNKSLKAAQQNPNILTNLELELGLKIDHFNDAILPTNYIAMCNDSKPIQKQLRKLTPALEKLFVLNTDKDTTKCHKWIIYMDGHGLYSYSLKKELRRFKKLYKYYKSQVTQKRGRPDYYESYQKNKTILEEIKQAIISLQKGIKESQNPFEGTIVSLPISEFKKVLNFFNNKINTGLLYYSSCYAGGEHLVTPFLTESNAPLHLNYTVMTGTLADNTALQEIPFMALPPYRELQMCTFTLDSEDFIDYTNQKLKIATQVNFKKFFEAAQKSYHLVPEMQTELATCVNHYLNKNKEFDKGCIGNIPSIRTPYSSEFNIIHHKEKWISLKNSESIYTITPDTDAILLYTPNINKVSFIKKSSEPIPCVSLVHGEGAHEFNTIEAPEYTLADIINTFSSLPALSSSKSFLIKKLIIKTDASLEKAGLYSTNKNNTITLHDVLILHRIHDTNNIQLMSQCLSIVTPLEKEFITGVYFSTAYNTHYKLQWSGTELDNNSCLEINAIAHQAHKQNLLSYHQELAQTPIVA